MLLKEFVGQAKEKLTTIYPPKEASSIVSVLCHEFFGVESYTCIVEPDFAVKEKLAEPAMSALERLMTGEPLQYVLGFADFCGERFCVNSSVLIPRPETEDLCRMVTERAMTLYRGRSAYGPGAGAVRIADLCTGSGCIAWTLARNVPESFVVGVDISQEAIQLASAQKFKEKAKPSFFCSDIFNKDLVSDLTAEGPFDIVVSNPPYILESERKDMRPNVLDFEPSIALFVPDGEPLKFYTRIAELCRDGLLAPGGTLFVEINENLAEQVKNEFSSFRFCEIEILKDFFGKPRFVKAKYVIFAH